ncbi:MAG: hypothetical protein ACXV5H_07060 [Halobacteriota archaeon]
MISINYVVLLREPKLSMELGEALWALSKEVENFYNLGEQRVIFRRSYLSEKAPKSILREVRESAFPTLQQSLRAHFAESSDQPIEQENSEVIGTVSSGDPKWDAAEGPYIQSYDAGKIAEWAMELAGPGPSGEKQVVVTDLLLAPPPGYSYIMWDSDFKVISILTADPEFWGGMKGYNRNAIIKHRVRTICLRIIGELIGLDHCWNERCFLFDPVDSVTRLDDMVLLGSEHDIKGLTQRGFEIFDGDPRAVQSIRDDPKNSWSWRYGDVKV